MTSRGILRLEGSLAVLVGLSLLALGTVQGRQGHLDAVVGGAVMLAMTAAWVRWRHGVRVRDLRGWFTRDRTSGLPARPTWRLAAVAVLDALLPALLGVAANELTGGWVTFMDLGVRSVVIGIVTLWPPAPRVLAHPTGKPDPRASTPPREEPVLAEPTGRPDPRASTRA